MEQIRTTDDQMQVNVPVGQIGPRDVLKGIPHKDFLAAVTEHCQAITMRPGPIESIRDLLHYQADGFFNP